MMLFEKSDDGQARFYLSRCRYCGKVFIKFYNATIYCSSECRGNATKEHTLKRVQRFYREHGRGCNKWVGTGMLGCHRHEDEDYELLMITREIKRLKLKT